MTDNTRKKQKRQTVVNKTNNRKLKIEQFHLLLSNT